MVRKIHGCVHNKCPGHVKTRLKKELWNVVYSCKICVTLLSTFGQVHLMTGHEFAFRLIDKKGKPIGPYHTVNRKIMRQIGSKHNKKSP